jgi:hypothetical protein
MKNEMGWAYSMYWRQERCVQGFGGGDLRERDHLEGLGIDRRIILKCAFKKWDGEAWSGLICLSRDRWRALVNAVMKLQVA